MKYLLLFILLLNLHAKTSNEFTKEELEWISQNPIVKVGVDEDWPPFDYLDKKKKHNGISAEYLHLISNQTGLKFEIHANDWATVMDKIKNKQLDILACAVKTTDREIFLNFTDPYLNLDIVVVGQKQLKLTNFEQIKHLKVAVQKDDYIHEKLKKLFPKIKFIYVKSNEDALKYVSYGKADVYIDNLPIINYFIEKDLLTNLEIKTNANFESSALSIAVIKEKPVLYSILQKALKNITNEEKERIIKKWVFTQNNSIQIRLSKEQQEWIKNHPIIKVGADANWPPFEYLDLSGKYTGIASEYLSLISKHTGLIFDVYANDWTSVLTQMKEKQLDMLSCVVETKDRKEFLNFSNSYLDVDIVVISRKNVKIKSFEDLEKHTIVVQKDNYVHEMLKNRFPNIKFIFVKSNLDAFKYVSYGKADVFIGNLPVISYFIEKELLTNLEIKFKADLKPAQLKMAVSKDNIMLSSIIKKVLPILIDKYHNELNKKWIFEFNKAIEIFNKEELEWIYSKPNITYAGDPNWMPFEGFNDRGEYIGLISDYLKLFEQNTQLDIKKIQTDSWSQTLQLSKDQAVDIIAGDIYNDALNKNYRPISPLLDSPIVIVMDENTPYIDNIESIATKKIAVIKGYGYLQKIYKLYPDIKFYEVDNIQEGLRAVARKKYDAILGSSGLMNYSIKHMGLEKLKIVGNTGLKMYLSLFVQKDNEILFNILSKYMGTLDELEHIKIKNKYNEISYETVIDYTMIWYVILVAFIGMLIFFYHNRRLSILVDKKTVELKNLLNTLESKVEQRTSELQKEKEHVEQLNEELKLAKEEAENHAKQKSEFLANMSHEIRTPMNSVIGFTDILNKELTDPIQRDYLESIKKGGNALLSIINDILDLSKIEAGKLEIKNESLNPKNFFQEIESFFHAKIISKNISFIINIDPLIPEYIIVDGVRLRQILFNLIGNALKFTEQGHITLEVKTIYTDEIKSKIDLMFSVEDTGIGIDQENLKTIFNAFEQQTQQDTAKYGGTGLGLAICSKLVAMMNGQISVESKKNIGSTFTVTLTNVAVSSMEQTTEDSPQQNLSNIVFKKAHILVVDDIPENQKLVKVALKDYDFDVILADNGKEAIEKLQNIHIDLILMDLRMPVMNGYEAATFIKNDPKLKNIPLVALTASVMGKDIEKVHEYKFDGYLRKPVIIDDLLLELSKYLKHSFLDNDISTQEEGNVYDQDTIKNTLFILENDLYTEYTIIKDGGDFMLIETFAIKLLDLANQNHIPYLKTYANELLKNIESFDIEKVEYLLNTYDNLLKKLKGAA